MKKFHCQGQIGIYIWLDISTVSIKEISSGAVVGAVLHWWPINNRAATVDFWQA